MIVGLPATLTASLKATLTCKLSPALKRLSVLSPSSVTLCTVGAAVSICCWPKLAKAWSSRALPAASCSEPATKLRLTWALAPCTLAAGRTTTL